jgi:hydrogenase large subunit
MPQTIHIDPVSRIEGHLKIEVAVNTAADGANIGLVTDAKCQSTLYRGFENILRRRDPRDAPVICQRI